MTFPSILKAGTKSRLICQPVGRGLLKSSGNWFCSFIPGGIGAVPFYLSINGRGEGWGGRRGVRVGGGGGGGGGG